MWRADPRRDELTDRQVRELAALDRALTGEPGDALDADQRALVGIVEAVRADHPPLRPAFAEDLARRLGTASAPGLAAAGPVRGTAADPGRRRLGPLGRIDRRQQLIGLGGAASVALAAAALVAGLGSAGDGHKSGSGVSNGSVTGSAAAVGSAPRPSVSRQAPSVATSPSTATAGGQSLAAPGAPRAVQSDASLTLVATSGHLQRASAAATAAIDRVGGIVDSSSVVVDNQGGSQATISARVPAADLEHVMAALSSIANVTSRSQNTLDITDPTALARQQLVESRAERAALLRQLAVASTPNEVASIHAQLGLAAGRIAQDEKDLQRLVDQARYATLSVSITESGQATGSGGGSVWTAGGAVDAAITVLDAAFAVLVIALAGLVPAGVLGALVWWSARAFRRRRRRGALAA